MRTAVAGCCALLAAACGGSGTAPGGGGAGGAGSVAFRIHFSGQGHGDVRSSSPVFGCDAECTENLAVGARIHLTPVPDSNSRFGGWSGACSGSGDCDLMVSSQTDVAARFDAIAPPVGQISIAVQVTGQGSVASNPTGITCGQICRATFATSVDLLPNPQPGWKFDGWGGACTGPDACHFAAPGDADLAVNVFATFVVLPPAADCAGIVPASLGTAVTATLTGGSCENATSDASGNVAADAAGHWFVFSPAGARLGDYVAESAIPQDSGFQGMEPRGLSSTLALVMRSPAGKVLAETGVGGTVPKAVRASDGGSVVISPICGGTVPGGIEIDRFDGNGKLSSRTSIPGGCNSALVDGVGDASGSTFVLLAGGQNIGLTFDVVGRWVDPAGQSLLGFFPVMARGSPQRSIVRALINGGIAIQLDGIWFATTSNGGTRVGPPPPFLRDNADHDFTIVRNRRAYALLPRGAGDPKTMTLYSASGNRCGTLTFPVGGLTTGVDGTVIGASGAGGCTKTWWPGLLR